MGGCKSSPLFIFKGDAMNKKVKIMFENSLGAVPTEANIDFYDFSEVEPGEEDLRFPATLAKQGANSKPLFDYNEIALIFPENDETHVAHYIAQLPHAYKPGSNVKPHVHLRLTKAGTPKFVMLYKWYNANGGGVPDVWQEIVLERSTAVWSEGIISSMIYALTPIDGTGKIESSIMLIKLYRQTGDGYSGNVLVDEFDVHFVAEKFGETF